MGVRRPRLSERETAERGILRWYKQGRRVPGLHTTEPADIERPTVLQHGAGAVVLASGPLVGRMLGRVIS